MTSSLRTFRAASENVTVTLLADGDIRTIESQGILMNGLIGNSWDGGCSNLFFRVRENGKYRSFPLVGRQSQGEWAVKGHQAFYRREAGDVRLTAVLTVVKDGLFWDVFARNHGVALECDVLFTQDIGMGTPGHVRANEAYNSQYIDAGAFATRAGYVLCYRQNQDQGGHPFLQCGCLDGAASFETDGFPFYGLSYKYTGVPEALGKPALSSAVCQYEFSFCALQSRPLNLAADGNAHVRFYTLFKRSVRGAVTRPAPVSALAALHAALTFTPPDVFSRPSPGLRAGTLCSDPFTSEDLDLYYPQRRHEEWIDGVLCSFFAPTGEHVVLMEKERYVRRPHGTISITGLNDTLDCARYHTLTTTSYIYGVFNAQVAVGNTSFNQLIGNTRDALNVQKITGQRLLVKQGETYKLLTMPAVFEMGFNYARWLYKLDGGIIRITAYTALKTPRLTLQVEAGRAYDWLLSSFIMRSPEAYEYPPAFTRAEREITIVPHADSMTAACYPDLAFTLCADRDFSAEISEDGEPLLLMGFDSAERFTCRIEGRIDGRALPPSDLFEAEKIAYREWLHSGIGGFRLSACGAETDPIDMLNDTAMWYAHNARIHYASPHGLEQYGGAAWGTRDVCQGPAEFFLAMQNHTALRGLLLNVYAHQFREDGSWPQWFMFDRYNRILADESHGDVIVWPAKALASYLSATGDMGILDEPVPFMSRAAHEPVNEAAPLRAHVKKQLRTIMRDVIPGTTLARYGNGDWDDTLQPADKTLRKRMVSGWTVSLIYQVLCELSAALDSGDYAWSRQLARFADRIYIDYHQYLIRDGVSAGFAVFSAHPKKYKDIRYLLHPRDDETGISYRLLPMTRSVIGGLFTKREAERHFELIGTHLSHPDGVRLMNRPCAYQGGVNRRFTRAETAANFGREIGLQYVHAHIRYIEACVKLGRADAAWRALQAVNPVGWTQAVPNATPCQRNCYFSSSDGLFATRYDAMRRFDLLRSGDIKVTTGWRIYSSGSGIYLNQLIRGFLGIRVHGAELMIDPVLPAELDGLRFDFAVSGKKTTFVYHIGCKAAHITINGWHTAYRRPDEFYREGGFAVPLDALNEGARVDVYLM
jgi:cellobiose phosphorylase